MTIDRNFRALCDGQTLVDCNGSMFYFAMVSDYRTLIFEHANGFKLDFANLSVNDLALTQFTIKTFSNRGIIVHPLPETFQKLSAGQTVYYRRANEHLFFKTSNGLTLLCASPYSLNIKPVTFLYYSSKLSVEGLFAATEAQQTP
jgi:hypothetical protein